MNKRGELIITDCADLLFIAAPNMQKIATNHARKQILKPDDAVDNKNIWKVANAIRTAKSEQSGALIDREFTLPTRLQTKIEFAHR